MSTKERYGGAVWDAVRSAEFDCRKNNRAGFAVGEIATRAGVSKPTARKYLVELVEMREIIAYVTPWGYSVYRAPRIEG